MTAQYVVTAPAVVAKDGTPTGEAYYYRDAILPAAVPTAEKERLVALGLVELLDVIVVEASETVVDPDPANLPDPATAEKAARAEAEAAAIAKATADAEAADAAEAAADAAAAGVPSRPARRSAR